MRCAHPPVLFFGMFFFADYFGKPSRFDGRKTFPWVSLVCRVNPRFRPWVIQQAFVSFCLHLFESGNVVDSLFSVCPCLQASSTFVTNSCRAVSMAMDCSSFICHSAAFAVSAICPLRRAPTIAEVTSERSNAHATAN